MFNDIWQKDYSKLANASMLQLFAQDNDLAVNDAKLEGRILSMSCIFKFIDDYDLHMYTRGLFTPRDVQCILLDTYQETILSEKKVPKLDGSRPAAFGFDYPFAKLDREAGLKFSKPQASSPSKLTMPEDKAAKAGECKVTDADLKQAFDNVRQEIIKNEHLNTRFTDFERLLKHEKAQKALKIAKNAAKESKKAALDAKDKVQKALQTKSGCFNCQSEEKKEDSRMDKDMQTILKPIISMMVISCPTDDTRMLKVKKAGVFSRELIPGYRFTVILNDGLNDFNYAVITESGSTAVTLNLCHDANSASVIDIIKRINDPDLVHLIDQAYQASLDDDTDFIAEFNKAIKACVAICHAKYNLHDNDKEPVTLDSLKSATKEVAKSAKLYADQAMDTAKSIYHDKVPYDKRLDIKRNADKANRLYQKGKTTTLSMLYQVAKKTAKKLDKYSDKQK